jgi:hypothetical protein
MTGARRLLAAEWRKVLTTKMLWILVLVGIVYSSVNVVTLALVAAGLFPGVPTSPLGSLLLEPSYITTLLGQAGTAATFVLVLGIIAMTGEYRHMTITSTFLSTPRRGQVLAAKMALYAILGALVAVVTVAIVTAVTIVTLIPLEHAPLTASAVGVVFRGALLGFVLYAVLGVSLGALIRSQIAAIIIALIWVLLVESLVGLAFPAVTKWLPGGALNAVMDVTVRADPTGALAPADTLPAWGAALVLLGYSVILAVLAALTTMRRDIT